MNLDEITVVIRPRRPAEAVDLGYRLVRAWWRPVYAAWATIALPLWVVAFLTCHRWPWAALLVLWWLRPLADRAALHVVSHGVFSDFPSWRQTLAAWPGLWRRQLWATLVFFRLDPARSFHLPLFQLEGLAGGAGRDRRRRRMSVLNGEGWTQAVLLTVASSLTELCLFFAALGFAGLVSPSLGMGEAIDHAFEALVGNRESAVPLLAGAAFAARALTGPAWVAAGFTLYLSARTRLEGWDVQLAFRRLAGRLRRSAAALLAGALLALPAVAQEAPAADAEAPPANNVERPAEVRAVRDVLADPDFETRREMTRWRPRDWWSEAEVPVGDRRISPFGDALSLAVGQLLRALLVAAALLLAVWLLREVLRRRGAPLPVAEGEVPTVAAASFGAAAEAEALPDDVPAAARALWRQGRPEAALGLLYRGALAALAARGAFPVEASWTEEECRRELAAALAPPAAAYFDTLTDGWTAAAYAGRPPGDEEIEGLCDDWPRHFREAA